MKITRTSPLTGQTNTLDLPIDRRSLRRWLNGEPVQALLPRPRRRPARVHQKRLHARRIRNLLAALMTTRSADFDRLPEAQTLARDRHMRPVRRSAGRAFFRFLAAAERLASVS